MEKKPDTIESLREILLRTIRKSKNRRKSLIDLQKAYDILNGAFNITLKDNRVLRERIIELTKKQEKSKGWFF